MDQPRDLEPARRARQEDGPCERTSRRSSPYRITSPSVPLPTGADSETPRTLVYVRRADGAPPPPPPEWAAAMDRAEDGVAFHLEED